MSGRDEWDAWEADWMLSLEGRPKAPQASTLKIYRQGLANLVEWARANGYEDPHDLDTRAMRRYFAHFRERKHKQTGEPISPAYIRRDYTSLVQWFKFLAAEGDRPGYVNPMTLIPTPVIEPKRIEILRPEELRALLRACEGTGFAERRDTALLRLLMDAGPRRGEIMSMTVADVDLPRREVTLEGKTGERVVGIGVKTAEALSRYLRARGRHKDSGLDELWLVAAPHRGAMGRDSLRLMLNRRAGEAHVDNVHPHRFRHTAFDMFQEDGGEDTTAMDRFGWSTRSMLDIYGRSNRERRSIRVAHRLASSDKI